MPRETLRISYLCLNLVRAMLQSWQVCTARSHVAPRQSIESADLGRHEADQHAFWFEALGINEA